MTTRHKRTTSETDGRVVVLNDEEWLALVDRQARRYLNMSGEEFIRAYRAGELDVDGPDHLDIMHVAMLLTDDILNQPHGG